MPIRGASRSTAGSHHDWVTVVLLISLAPLSVSLGLLVAVSDAVSRVVGHRGKLLPRLQNVRRKKPSEIKEGRNEEVVLEPRGPRCTILIAGSSPLGLALARAFTKGGHRVVVTDRETVRFLNRARYSRGVWEFVPSQADGVLGRIFGRKPRELSYPEQMLQLAKSQKANVWIPCDDSVNEEEIMQAAGVIKMHCPNCLVLFPGPESLELSWDSKNFRGYVNSLESRIKAPGSSIIRSRGEVHRILGSRTSMKSVILSGPISMEDADAETTFIKGHQWRDSGYSESSSVDLTNGEEEDEESKNERSYPLPLDTLDKTYDLLTSIPISHITPWRASEAVTGKPCTIHALIENNSMRALTAYVGLDNISFPSLAGDGLPVNNSLPPSLHPLDPKSPLLATLQAFTDKFITKLPGYVSATLTLRFIVSERSTDCGVELRPWVISCNFSTPKALLAIPGAINAWTSTIAKPCIRRSVKPSMAASDSTPITPARAPDRSTGMYSLPSAIFFGLITPIWLFIIRDISLVELLQSWRSTIEKVLYGRENLWDWDDPVAFMWYWVVERPIEAFIDLTYRRLKFLRLVS